MSILIHLGPAMATFRTGELARAGLGALVGLSICAAVASLERVFPSIPLELVAPLGATAVLVFCAPNSPLAQPWSAVVGNVISALVAVLMIRIVPSPWAVGVAVGAAISAMMLLRALHPPGGAVALLIALDPAPMLEAGALFALVPVGVLTASLVLVGIAYNRLTGRVYPFRKAEPATGAPAPRLGLGTRQLGELLARFNQTTNLGAADLGRLLAAAESEAVQHRFDGTSCADVMTRELITVRPDTPLTHIAKLFQDHPIKSLPVVDETGHFSGIILQSDLLRAMTTCSDQRLWRKRLRPGRAGDVMRQGTGAVAHDLPVGTLLTRFSARGNDVVPVTKNDRLVGILTRSDIMRLMMRGSDNRKAA